MTIQMLRSQRTEFGKRIRKAYESGEIKMSRHKMRVMTPRMDGINNTLTTVEKDTYMIEYEDTQTEEPDRG